jgi:hypothetical protein
VERARGCREELQIRSVVENCQCRSFLSWIMYQKIVESSLRCPKLDVGEPYMCFIECPKFWCTIDELGDSRAVKSDFIQNSYIHDIELRSVYAGQKFL